MSTDAQIRANQANAQLSTGPKTEAGREKSSRNAVKTGLTGRTVLLSSDDHQAYEQHLQRFQTQYQPQQPRESELVQSIADTQWRLHRIPSLEMGIYAVGRLEFAAEFANQPADVQPALIEARTHLAYHRQLSNLSLQEGRLRRRYQEDLAELVKLQETRRAERQKQYCRAHELYYKCARYKYPFDLAEFGLEITEAEFEAFMDENAKKNDIQTGEYFKRKRKIA